MNSHVVQIAQAEPAAAEVIASFPNRSEATAYALRAHQNDSTGHFEYLVMDDDSLKEARKQFQIDSCRSSGA